jgi:hypothetical protein
MQKANLVFSRAEPKHKQVCVRACGDSLGTLPVATLWIKPQGPARVTGACVGLVVGGCSFSPSILLPCCVSCGVVLC